METVLKAIADWIKGILTAGIMSNLSGLFDDVNTQVGNIAQQVGTKPSSFEPRVFAMLPLRGEQQATDFPAKAYRAKSLLLGNRKNYNGKVFWN